MGSFPTAILAAQLKRKPVSETAAPVRTSYVRLRMDELRFEWDPKKDAANQRKHGVSFQEATTVFSDEQALLLDDPEYSVDEERFMLWA